jgi:hypothetical protein
LIALLLLSREINSLRNSRDLTTTKASKQAHISAISKFGWQNEQRKSLNPKKPSNALKYADEQRLKNESKYGQSHITIT